MATDTPECINLQLLENALMSYYNEKDNIKVTGFTCTRAVDVGENYASDLVRCTINYTKENGNLQSMNVLVKCSPIAGVLQGLVKEIHLFDKEAEMFQKTLPRLHKILGEGNIFSSDCLDYVKTYNRDLLVLMDLRPSGYTMADRHKGLPLDHCLLTIEKIAKFHAASVIMIDQDPTSVSSYMNGLFSDESPTIRDFILAGFGTLKTICNDWTGCEKYVEKLAAINDDDFLSRCFESGRRRTPNEFKVLNHGDLWLNNMLFLYHANGTVKDVKFVDYQIGVYASPALDLHYFLATSVQEEVRHTYFESLLDTYYVNLLLHLVQLGYPLKRVPTWKEFRQDFDDRAFYEVVTATTVLPLIKSPKRDDANYDHFIGPDSDGQESFRTHSFKNTCYRSIMENVLFPYFYDSGLLD